MDAKRTERSRGTPNKATPLAGWLNPFCRAVGIFKLCAEPNEKLAERLELDLQRL